MNTTVPDDLTALYQAGKSATFDYLPASAGITQIAETLVALANTRAGGQLVLDTGLTGETITHTDEALADLTDRALSAILTVSPRLIIPMPARVTIDNRQAVVVNVPAGLPQVYALDGRYLRRDGTKNVPLTPPELRRLLIQRGEITFETEIHPRATRDDLDWEKVKAYALRAGAGDVDALLVKRGCAVITDGVLHPTNAGILLFGKDVQSLIRGAEITAVRFAGENMGDSFSRQDINGTLPEQIRTAETFLRDHLRKGVALTGAMARTEHYEYPLEAVRELVVNAVAHRDYSISGDGIRLYVFKDHLEITSPGLLPGPVTLANIKDERFSRNPAIVQVLADMGFIERLGYGIDRVLELMRGQSLRVPDFNETGGGVRVTLYNVAATNDPPSPAVDADERPTEPARPPDIASLTATPSSAPVLAHYRDIPLNPRQESALAYLAEAGNTRITNSELQRLFPDVHAETIRRDLSDLVAKDILNKMGEKRGAYYILKREEEREPDDKK